MGVAVVKVNMIHRANKDEKVDETVGFVMRWFSVAILVATLSRVHGQVRHRAEP
jgi:hypothetical protein